ncbi:MAG: ABC transporter substrate-binding protein [Endomicrobium sp.]|jgi:NitT/TauT family transport system substrate-binding protein|nr:ABC transporter substrate-binding protein [Endomicrobium sp.]
MKKLLCVVLTAVVMSFGVSFTGCSSKPEGGQEASKAAASKKIKMGISAFPGWFVYYIAKGEDFFKKNGVDVELVWFPVYSDSLQAFNSGNLDMLCIALPDAPAPYLKGTKFKIVAVNDFSNGADGIVARSDRKIESLKDLKGKKVATEYGTIEHFFLLKALETAGLKESDINLVNISIGDSAPAIISGAVDAAGLWEPALSIALADKGIKRLYSSNQTPGLIQDVTIATEDLIKNNPQAVYGVINAFLDSIEFYKQNPDKSIEYMKVPADVDTQTMKEIMAGGKIYGLKDMIAEMTQKQDSYLYGPYNAYQNALFLQSVNLIDNAPQDKDYFVNMFDPSFILDIAKIREVSEGPDTSLK